MSKITDVRSPYVKTFGLAEQKRDMYIYSISDSRNFSSSLDFFHNYEHYMISSDSDNIDRAYMFAISHAYRNSYNRIVILRDDVKFLIDDDDLKRLLVFLNDYDMVSLNPNSGNDCWIMNKRAIDYISKYNVDISKESWKPLMDNMIRKRLLTGKVGSDVLTPAGLNVYGSSAGNLQKVNVMVSYAEFHGYASGSRVVSRDDGRTVIEAEPVYGNNNGQTDNVLSDVVISLTSYGDRIRYVPDVVRSILENTLRPYKICLTLFVGDVDYITDELEDMIQNNEVELITCDEDLKPHKKYFYVMQEYRDKCIITIDDDIIYTNDLVESLYDNYLKYPDAVSARKVHQIKYNENRKCIKYNFWNKSCQSILTPSYDLFPLTGAGTLFPPDILKINDSMLSDIKKCLTADDVYLKWVMNSKNIKVSYVKNDANMGAGEIYESSFNGLWRKNVLKNENDVYLRKYPLFGK